MTAASNNSLLSHSYSNEVTNSFRLLDMQNFRLWMVACTFLSIQTASAEGPIVWGADQAPNVIPSEVKKDLDKVVQENLEPKTKFRAWDFVKTEVSKEIKTQTENSMAPKPVLGVKAIKLIEARKSPVFDIPVAYNGQVKKWMEYYQGGGREWFSRWLGRSTKYLPMIKATLSSHGVPQDLAYMAMIESGFSAHAVSTAQAVGPWQFIRPTAERYGLQVSWWRDERRDYYKSTVAAAKYLRQLHKMFGDWNLVAASYNTGENRIKRLIQKTKTRSYWKLSRLGALPDETAEYVPKLMAAILISKSPKLYGFNDINFGSPPEFEHHMVPGGSNIFMLAWGLGIPAQVLKDLNPELRVPEVPQDINLYKMRIPKGTKKQLAHFLAKEVAEL